jgi:hypothetical protein
MDRRNTATLLVPLAALFTLSGALAQQPSPREDPTVPEDANDEQTMVPEDAEDDVTPGEDADDTPAAAGGARTTTEPESPNTTTQPPQSTQTPAPPLRQAAAAPAPTPVASPARVLIVPAGSSDRATENGCWVRLYSGSGLAGESITIVGPISLPELRGPFGMAWDERIGSIEAGPGATLSLYADERYEDVTGQLAAGQRLTSMGRELESLRIACGNRAPG